MKTRILASLLTLSLIQGDLGAYASDLYDVEASPFHTFIAKKTGDIVTIVIWEKAETTDDAQTELTRENDAAFDFTKIFFPPVDIAKGLTRTNGEGDPPGFSMESESGFKAKGKNKARHLFKATIEARLIEEVVDGQFVVRGHRMVNINGKQKKIFVSGVIRQRDITPFNTVDSDKIVDAVIEIEGQVGKDDTQPGPIMRLMNLIF